MRRGAEFGEITPRKADGSILLTQAGAAGELDAASQGTGEAIDRAFIRQVTPTNSFRLGQQVFFWLGLFPSTPNGYYSQVRLKLWWLRPNVGYRAAGFPSWQIIDRTTFGDGPVVGDPLANNRYVWVPSPKRLDLTQYQTPPPNPSPPRHSDSLLLDDCWTMDFGDPALYGGLFPSPQNVSRWAAFLYPAMGYALGFTWDFTFSGGPPPGNPSIPFSLTWQTGTLGGSVYQESIG